MVLVQMESQSFIKFDSSESCIIHWRFHFENHISSRLDQIVHQNGADTTSSTCFGNGNVFNKIISAYIPIGDKTHHPVSLRIETHCIFFSCKYG